MYVLYEADLPSIEDIIPMQGFASILFGFRIRSFGSGGKRGATFKLTRVVGFGGIVSVVTRESDDFDCY